MISGTTTSLRPTGIGRFFVAAFLSFWLIGWVLGEVFAIAMLGTIGRSIAGAAPERLLSWPADIVTSGGAAVAVLFLLVWLTFWTIGGIVALGHVMRSLVGEDVLSLKESGFEVVRRAGPFRRRYAFERSAIRRLRVRPHDRAVLVDTAKGARVITTFGMPAERDAVADWLKHHLGLPDADATGTPPAAWDVRVEGDAAFLRKVRAGARFTRSLIAWLLTGAAVWAWYASLDPAAPIGSVAALLFSLLLAVGAAMSTWGRREWIVRPGELMFRRSFALWSSERTFRDARLEVTHETDSDNDNHYALVVVDTAGRRTLHSQVHDSGEVVDLAHWLASRTGFRVTSSEKLHTFRIRTISG